MGRLRWLPFLAGLPLLFAAEPETQPGYLRGELIYPLDHRPTPQCHASTIAESYNFV